MQRDPAYCIHAALLGVQAYKEHVVFGARDWAEAHQASARTWRMRTRGNIPEGINADLQFATPFTVVRAEGI